MLVPLVFPLLNCNFLNCKRSLTFIFLNFFTFYLEGIYYCCIFAMQKMRSILREAKLRMKMKDYLSKINNAEEERSVVNEPAYMTEANQTKQCTISRVSGKGKQEVAMPCYFSECELDEEIRLSMKSGNATQSEVDAVFCR